jgi:hypothetical protein
MKTHHNTKTRRKWVLFLWLQALPWYLLFCCVTETAVLCDKLKASMLYLPATEIAEGELNLMCADGRVFTLHRNTVKPLSANITPEERIFAYRLSRAGRTVVSDFGISGNQFRVFHTATNKRREQIHCIVLAACVTRDFLRRCTKLSYMPQVLSRWEIQILGKWLPETGENEKRRMACSSTVLERRLSKQNAA